LAIDQWWCVYGSRSPFKNILHCLSSIALHFNNSIGGIGVNTNLVPRPLWIRLKSGPYAVQQFADHCQPIPELPVSTAEEPRANKEKSQARFEYPYHCPSTKTSTKLPMSLVSSLQPILPTIMTYHCIYSVSNQIDKYSSIKSGLPQPLATPRWADVERLIKGISPTILPLER
jgi:hypothetical protein